MEHLDALTQLLGIEVVSSVPVSGGDFARSYRIELADGQTLFAKTHASPPPLFFSTEAAGLRWLAAADAANVPAVVAVSDDPPLLAIRWVATDRAAPPDEATFGRQLAHLHQFGAETFGRADSRTTGSQAMPNDPCESWAEFLGERRLLPLSRIARDRGALGPSSVGAVEALAARLTELVGPPEPPARLHGDLWAGNRIVDRDGASWLIDPACFGGHREFDLALMRLFGGFGPEAFSAYNDETPLADGWEGRISLMQLPTLIVHAIKFGGGYVKAVDRAVQQYT